MIKVSYSRISAYLDCPYKYHLGYVRKLTPKGVVRPLTFGGDFHSLLEVRGNEAEVKKKLEAIEESFYDLNPQFQSDLGDNYLDEIKEIFSDYQKVWEGEKLPDVTEHEFNLPIAKTKGEKVVFHGFIDEVYTDDNMIGEHKTFGRKPNMGTLAMNTQINLYAKAYELETGVPIKRVQWDYIKSSPASRPIWLVKSGRLSEGTNASITPYSWLRACVENGITDPKFLEKAGNYESNIDNFFFRKEMEIIPEMMESVWRDFKDATKMILLNPIKSKHITQNCNWCKFRPICYTELTGGDPEYVIQEQFELKKER